MRTLLFFILFLGTGLFAQSFPNGPSTDPAFFPIAVWLQGTHNIANYQAIGINMYVGLWAGPTQSQLQALKGAGMPVICDQNTYALASLATYGGIIKGWMHGDEPDNAQWNEATQTYDPCIDTAVVKADYTTWRSRDSTRPVYLNLGMGVSYISWVGRGACTGNTRMYPGYIRGCDIVSYDIYPVNSEYAQVRDNLWYVPKGVDSLRRWGNDKKPVWCWIECTAISANQKPTPAQVKSEVWMALIHGAKGFGYFCHSWYPSFVEAALLADTAMKNGVDAINAQVRALAPALNSATLETGVSVSSSNTAVPVDAMVKAYRDSVYLFASAVRSGTTNATFTLNNFSGGSTVDVIGEGRTLTLTANRFTDAFNGYGVHLYRVRGSVTSAETAVPLNLSGGDPARFVVYDIKGRLVRDQKGIEGLERGLPNGLYLWRISGGGSHTVLKRMILK